MLHPESYEEAQRWPEHSPEMATVDSTAGGGQQADARHGAQRGARVSQGARVALNMRPDQTSPELIPNLMRRYSGSSRREAIPAYVNTPNLAAITNDGAAYEDDSLYGSTVDLHLNTTEPNPRNLQERRNEPTAEERMRPQRGNPESSTPAAPTTSTGKTTEELFWEMAQTLTKVLQQTANPHQGKQKWGSLRRGIPYTYEGMDYENPEWFIKKMEEVFHDAEIDDDIEKINLVGEQLRGKARAWFNASLQYITRYEGFLDLFMERFNSPEEIADVLTRLYGEKQRPHEPVATFLSKKKRMIERLIPEQPLKITVSIVLKLLHPEIRSRIRGLRYATYEELIRLATDVEEDLDEARREQKHQTSAATPAVNITRREIPATGAYSRERPATSAPPRPRPTNVEYGGDKSRPPTPCKHCNEWHYHSECPRNPYRSLNYTRAEKRDIRRHPSAPEPATSPRKPDSTPQRATTNPKENGN